MSIKIRLYQLTVLLAAAAVFVVLLHWMTVQPPLITVEKGQVSSLAELMFRERVPWTGYANYHAVVQILLGIVWAFAAVIAAMLAVKVPDNIAIRRLSGSLVIAALAGTYVSFATLHEPYRGWIHWQPSGAGRFLLDTLVFAAMPLAAILLVRFFMGYPRQILLEEWAEYDIRKFKEREVSLVGWRRWANSKLTKYFGASDRGLERTRRFAASSYQLLRSPRVFVACVVAGTLMALTEQSEAAGWIGSRNGIRTILGLVLPILSLVMGLGLTLQCLHLHRDFALPDDRERWSWLAPALEFISIAALVIWVACFFGVFLILRFNPDLLRGAPADVLLLGSLLVPAVLAMLGFLTVLAASVFYRGAADPRLAMRKITVFGVVGILLAFVFVLTERVVALQIAKALGLASETAILVAGAAVAATFGPIRNGAERFMNKHLARWLPLEHIVDGDRKSMAIVIADLSGYTQLSSRDEKQAMLVAAAFQRQAERLAADRNGRVVKSMGDAVLVAFESAEDAAQVLLQLPVEFTKTAQQIGVIALPVHSGAHLGEVTVTADGDVYGQTVNLAARLQASAESGQTVVSEAFASAAKGAAFTPVGDRKFKNVPGTVPCLILES